MNRSRSGDTCKYIDIYENLCIIFLEPSEEVATAARPFKRGLGGLLMRRTRGQQNHLLRLVGLVESLRGSVFSIKVTVKRRRCSSCRGRCSRRWCTRTRRTRRRACAVTSAVAGVASVAVIIVVGVTGVIEHGVHLLALLI